MGTAFSFPCSDNKHCVTIVGTHLENDFIDQINLKKTHPALELTVPKNVKFVKLEKKKDKSKKVKEQIPNWEVEEEVENLIKLTERASADEWLAVRDSIE